MEAYELNTSSFIIKVWVEEIGEETAQMQWRGHITHVLSGKRQYIQELGAVVDFITLYLDQMRLTANRSDG